MNATINYLGVFLIGVLAAGIGATVGGGGLLSIPFLIWAGLPPQIAIATNRFGSVGLSVGALAKFSKERRVVWRYVISFTLISMAGGYLGARILLAVDEKLLSKIVGAVLLGLLPFIILQKDMGVVRTVVKKGREVLGYLAYFVVSIWGGFFAGGAGIFNRYIYTYFFGLTMVEASATNKIPWIVSSLVVLATFIYNDVVHYGYGVTLFIGMLVGGYLGAHWAVKKGDLWVKRAFVVFVLISAAQLIFFS